MTLPTTGFLGIWGTSILAWMALLYQYNSKWKRTIEDLGTDIREFNTRTGLTTMRVDKEDIASDFLIPTRTGNIEWFASDNGISTEQYLADLRNAVEKPYTFWGYAFIVVGAIYTLAGVSYFLPGSWVPPVAYVVSVWIFFIFGMVIYLYL